MIEIKRDFYLNQLKEKQGNGLVKIITGIRRFGKSYLLFELYRKYLLQNGVKEEQIIALSLDNDENEKYWNPTNLSTYLKSKIINDDLLKNNGIKTYDCKNTDDISVCEFLLGTNQRRTLEILKNKTDKDTETITQNGKNIGTKTYEKTTLRYSDSTTGDVKTLLIKTIELIVRSNNESGNNEVTKTGYKFTDLEAETFSYINEYNDTYSDKITHIIIGLSDEKYNIDLYSSGTYKNN